MMTLRILLAVLISVIVAACDEKESDLIYTAEKIPYSRSAYDAGRVEAEADLKAGRLVILDYGVPRKGQNEFEALLRERYEVEVRRVANEVVNPTIYGRAFGYNDVSKPEIKRRFGNDVLERLEQEAARTWDEDNSE